jgi:hypothetical protein
MQSGIYSLTYANGLVTYHAALDIEATYAGFRLNILKPICVGEQQDLVKEFGLPTLDIIATDTWEGFPALVDSARQILGSAFTH